MCSLVVLDMSRALHKVISIDLQGKHCRYIKSYSVTHRMQSSKSPANLARNQSASDTHTCFACFVFFMIWFKWSRIVSQDKIGTRRISDRVPNKLLLLYSITIVDIKKSHCFPVCLKNQLTFVWRLIWFFDSDIDWLESFENNNITFRSQLFQ